MAAIKGGDSERFLSLLGQTLLGGVIGSKAKGAEKTSVSAQAKKIIIDRKIMDQLGDRGWTRQEVQALAKSNPVGTTVDKRSSAKTVDGMPRNDPATVYGSKSGYVVVNDRTGEVVQVSGKNDPKWVPDSRIKWSESQ